MKDVLCFINELDFTDNLDNDYLQKIVEAKMMMVRVFEDHNISKMTHALNIIHERKLSKVIKDLYYRLERTDSLRSVVFCSINFEHLVVTNNEQVVAKSCFKNELLLL